MLENDDGDDTDFVRLVRLGMIGERDHMSCVLKHTRNGIIFSLGYAHRWRIVDLSNVVARVPVFMFVRLVFLRDTLPSYVCQL